MNPVSRIGWAGTATFLLRTHAQADSRPKMGLRRPSVSCRGSGGSRRPACSVTKPSTPIYDTFIHLCHLKLNLLCLSFQTKKPWNSLTLHAALCPTSLGVKTCWGRGGGGRDMPCQASSGTRPTSHGGACAVQSHFGFPGIPTWITEFCMSHCCRSKGKYSVCHTWILALCASLRLNS